MHDLEFALEEGILVLQGLGVPHPTPRRSLMRRRSQYTETLMYWKQIFGLGVLGVQLLVENCLGIIKKTAKTSRPFLRLRHFLEVTRIDFLEIVKIANNLLGNH